MRFFGLVLVGLIGTWGCGGGSGDRAAGGGGLTAAGSPTGKVVGAVRVQVAFSRPMVVAGRVGAPASAPPITFAPPLEVEASWSDERTLVVVPRAGLPASTRFVATVPAGTKALDGASLAEPYTFELSTEQLRGALEVIGSKERASKSPVVRATFIHEVPFDQVAKHCAFTAGSTRHAVVLAPDTPPPAGPAKTFALVPANELATDTEWTVACETALRGSAGNLGLETRLEEKLRTHGPLRFIGLEPSGADIVPDENLRLALAFTNPLAPPYHLKIEPAVPGVPERCHGLGDQPAGLSCSGARLEANTSYKISIDATQRDVFGQTLGAPQTVELRTSDALPTVSLESGYFVAELRRPVVPVWARNVTKLGVTLAKVTPATFHALQPKLDWWETSPIDFAGTKLAPRTKEVAVAGTKNQWGQQAIDPAALLGQPAGPGMYYVEIAAPEVKRHPFEGGTGRSKVLVNFTDIGAVSKLSPARGLVWATQLSTGKPLAGAAVTARDGTGKVTWTGTTDADGVAVLPGTAKLAGKQGAGAREHADDPGLRIYVAHGADWTMVNPTRSGGLSAWNYNVSVDWERAPIKLRGFMHTDRGLYRPGEKVHVKGLARHTRLGEPLAVPGAGKPVRVEVEGPQGKTFAEAEAKLSAFGGFWFDLDLPADARLGDYTIRAKLDHGTFTREFTVEEYRPATFEVTGKLADARVVERGTVKGTIHAGYLYGAPLRSGTVDVTVHARPRRVAFPEHAGYEFLDERRYDSYWGESEHSQTLVAEDQAALDAKGDAALAVAISPNDVHADSDLLVRAAVSSPSNEVIAKTFTVPYFRSQRYFGIKSPGYVIDVGKPRKVSFVAVTPDGKPADGPAAVTITRRDWSCVWEDWGYRGSYQCKDTNHTIVSKTIQLAGGKPGEVEFTPEKDGDYWIVVEGAPGTAGAAAAATQVYAWGSGGGAWRTSDAMSFDIVTDKKEYAAGDTATLMLKTDLAQATGLVTIERDGVIEKRLIEVTPAAKHVTIPITAAHAPNVYVSVALVQGRLGDGPRGKPRMRMGLVNLPVRPADNKLLVTVATDRKDYRPGAPVTATVKVTDAAGQPVSAEVSITAADEGVLSLINYATPNPIPTFYAPWGIGVSTATQIEYIRDIPGPNVTRPASGGDAPGTLRSRFVSTAVWKPGAVTNAAGIATVKFAAPDNLTAFRVMAVAADKGQRFGSGDQRFTVSKPLQLHQALPRFVTLGDQLQAGVVVHNETGRAGTATVKLVGDGKLTIGGAAERTVAIAKDARELVLFALTGAEQGEAVLRFSVTMNGEGDAVEFKLPVHHPSPVRVHHVAHAATRAAASIAVALPPGAIPASAELVVSVDPDGLTGIEDGLRDLIGYPYGCLEQTTSKVIPMIAVRDLAESLAIGGLTGDKLEGFVREGVAKIGRHQTAYGGFSLWPGGEPDAYYTAYALWGLHLAKQAGYKVDAVRVADGLRYLRSDGQRPDTSRPTYDEIGNLGSQAFALYVRAMLGDKDTQGATALAANAKLPVYGKAYVARALAAGLGAKDPAVTKLVGELGELAAAAGKAGALIDEPGRGLDAYMSSPLRTTAMVLDTLVELDPRHDAIPALVRAVMKHRRATPYLDTQENLYSLLAFAGYARTVAGQPPSVTVELGGAPLLAGTLAGKQRLRVATAPLPAGGGTVELRPTGEVHYAVTVRYRQAPDALRAEAHGGLAIEREYLDEAGNPKTAFRAGDVVRVRLKVQLDGVGHHLMIADALPAGFEALNTKLATVGSAGAPPADEWGTFRELRDQRVDFATEYAERGRHTREYLMRAIAVGTFARRRRSPS